MPDPITNDTAEEQNYFTWWIIMILFFIPIVGMLCIWWQNRGETKWLVFAGGTLVIGLVLSAMAVSAGDTGGSVADNKTKQS